MAVRPPRGRPGSGCSGARGWRHSDREEEPGEAPWPSLLCGLRRPPPPLPSFLPPPNRIPRQAETETNCSCQDRATRPLPSAPGSSRSSKNQKGLAGNRANAEQHTKQAARDLIPCKPHCKPYTALKRIFKPPGHSTLHWGMPGGLFKKMQ